MGQVLLALLTAAAFTQGGLRRAFEAAQSSTVEVIGPSRSGVGVVVAADHVVTSTANVGLDRAQVRVGEAVAEARVVAADGKLKLAVLRLEGAPFPLRPAAVRQEPGPRLGEVLLGLEPGRSGTNAPTVARITKSPSEQSPFLESGHRVAPGSPLFDSKGRLVAVAVEKRGRKTRALPVAAIRRFLENSMALQRAAGATP